MQVGMASASLKMQMSSGGSCSPLVGMDWPGMGMGMGLLPGQLHWGICSPQSFLRRAGEWDLGEREQEHSHPGCWDQI